MNETHRIIADNYNIKLFLSSYGYSNNCLVQIEKNIKISENGTISGCKETMIILSSVYIIFYSKNIKTMSFSVIVSLVRSISS